MPPLSERATSIGTTLGGDTRGVRSHEPHPARGDLTMLGNDFALLLNPRLTPDDVRRLLDERAAARKDAMAALRRLAAEVERDHGPGAAFDFVAALYPLILL